MKRISKLLPGIIGLGVVFVPIAASQGVTGIRLQAAPNTIIVGWSAPAGIAVDHYKIYYARESFLENNGQFEDSEETLGDETTVVLFDLKNRGFGEGDVIFVAVTAIDTTGKERMDITEEANTAVLMTAAPVQAAPPPLLEIPQLQSRPRPQSQSQPQPQPQPPSPSPSPSPPLPLPDVTPPEDPTDLQLTFSTEPGGRYTVHASWDASLDTFGDLLSYNLYESSDGGIRFIGPTALRATVLSAVIANIPPGTFTAKVTAMDRSGNESRGIVKSITLPETGGMALAVSIAGAALWMTGRKRRRV